jgi:type IV secretory pathway VirB4 component
MDSIYDKIQNAFYELTEGQAKMKINSERRKGEEPYTQESIKHNIDNAVDLVAQVMLRLDIFGK